MNPGYKFGCMSADEQKCYRYSNVWVVGETTGPNRLVIAPEKNHVELMIRLARVMPDPFWVLYVLAVPRGGGDAGRYQSEEPQTRDAVEAFLTEFKTFLEGDGRHNMWIASSSSSQMLIYDRHNVIYAYGPSEEFKAVLTEAGLTSTESIQFPVPHVHQYRPEFDVHEGRMLDYWAWRMTPLQDSDDE